MNRRAEFLDIFLRGAGPSPELLGAFALGLLVVGVLGNLTYDLLTQPELSLPLAWRPLAAAALLTGLAYILYRRDRRKGQTVQAEFDERRLAPPHAGLIWVFGPGTTEHLLHALQHHHKDGGAVHCWLVMQNIQTVHKAFSQLSQQLLECGLTTQLHPLYVQQLDVKSAYQAVRGVFTQGAAEKGLGLEDIIADITGGTKPMTAGMVLAALTCGGALEYVESERDDEGKPVPGTLRDVLLDTTFYVERGE